MCTIYDFITLVPISLPGKHAEDDDGLILGILWVWYMCLCYEVTLTKNLREGLMFLDDHMSTSRRNEKHLKVTFAKFVVAAAATAVEGSRWVKKDKTDTGKMS